MIRITAHVNIWPVKLEAGSRLVNMKRALTTFFLSFGLLLAVSPVSGQSPDGQATLVIVDSRDPYLWDYRVRFYDESGKEVATMKWCQIVRLNMTPGAHRFRSNKDKKRVIEINAVAGETYYARAGLKVIFPRNMWFEFELLARKDAESWISKCKLPASALDDDNPKPE
ncbi:MAG TPA: hypothetical protein VFU86_13345 [Terriglobales bacterium]|nr:hypothetical protein [Terriglobales bacterium]